MERMNLPAVLASSLMKTTGATRKEKNSIAPMSIEVVKKLPKSKT